MQILAPTNQVLKVLSWSVFFDGISSSAEPVLVELVRQTSAGTMSALTARKIDPGRDETIQTTCTHTATAEPTDSGDVPTRKEVHPQSGYEVWFPYGHEMIVPGAGRLGLRCTAPAGVNVVGSFRVEE